MAVAICSTVILGLMRTPAVARIIGMDSLPAAIQLFALNLFPANRFYAADSPDGEVRAFPVVNSVCLSISGSSGVGRYQNRLLPTYMLFVIATWSINGWPWVCGCCRLKWMICGKKKHRRSTAQTTHPGGFDLFQVAGMSTSSPFGFFNNRIALSAPSGDSFYARSGSKPPSGFPFR